MDFENNCSFFFKQNYNTELDNLILPTDSSLLITTGHPTTLSDVRVLQILPMLQEKNGPWRA